MNIYSIKNEKLNFFNRPIYCESSAEALSYIQNVLMSDADRALLGLRGDLALYFLGEVDFTTGKINTDRKCPVKICDLNEIFNTIPEESIPRDSQALKKLIDDLSVKVKDLSERLEKSVSVEYVEEGK